MELCSDKPLTKDNVFKFKVGPKDVSWTFPFKITATADCNITYDDGRNEPVTYFIKKDSPVTYSINLEIPIFTRKGKKA